MSQLITIAIPTFDRFEYLKEAVASALAQTYDNLEVLIGDDGSSEEIRVWGERMARENGKVRYRRNPRNLGLAGNWNALADAAHGEFLVIIGDDDRLLPEFVATLIDVIQPSAQVAFSNHYLIDQNGLRLEELSREWTRLYRRDLLLAGEIVDTTACVWQNSIPMSAALMRTKVIQRLHFKEDLNTPEIELFARLAQEGGRFAFTPRYLSEYRTHQRSATTAGLRSEKLVDYLAAIKVAADVEPYKREFMAGLLIDAVGRCLQQNKRDLARQFLSHEYYPRRQTQKDRQKNGAATLTREDRAEQSHAPSSARHALTAQAQRLCASLPEAIGCRAYRLMRRIRVGR